MSGVIEQIALDMLTATTVSVRRERTIEVEGEILSLTPHRKAYMNSPSGRQQVQAEIPEPYQSAIFAVWGESPTVADPVEETENESDTGSAE
jgi:hypothetical protein